LIVGECRDSFNMIFHVFRDNPKDIVRDLVCLLFEEKIVGFLSKALQGLGRKGVQYWLQVLDIVFTNTMDAFDRLQVILQEEKFLITEGGYQVSIELNKTDLMERVFSQYYKKYITKEKLFFEEQVVGFMREYQEVEGKESRPTTRSINIKITKARSYFRSKATKVRDNRIKQKMVESNLMENIARIIKVSSHSMARCKRISPSEWLAENVFSLFRKLAGSVRQTLLEYALPECSKFLPNAGYMEPGLDYLQSVKTVNSYVCFFEEHVTEVILPLLSSSLNDCTICEQRKGELLFKVERQLVDALGKLLNACVQWTARILENETKKTDYRPGVETGLDDDMRPTAGCRMLCAWVNKVYREASSTLEGANLDNFLRIFGLRVCLQVEANLKRFEINRQGGMQLKIDIKEMEYVFDRFNLPEVKKNLTEFSLICNVFNIEAVSVKDFIRSYDEKFEDGRVRALALLRTDFTGKG